MATQAAELRLNLALDLKFFRQQLQKAQNIAASEFTPQINIRINRQTLDRELNNLQRSLKRRSYRVELKSNFKAEAEYAERIAATVPALERAAAAFRAIGKGNKDVASVLSKQEKVAQSLSRALTAGPTKGGASASQVEALYRKAYEAKLSGITGSAGTKAARAGELAKAFASMSVNAVNSFLDEFQKGTGKGKQSGIALGDSVLKGIKTSMQIASPSKKMKELGKDASEGFVIGLNEGLDDVEKYANRIKAILDGVAKEIATTGKTIASIQGKRLGLSNLPLMSRSLEGRGERAAGSVGGAASLGDLKAIYPEIRRTIASLSELRQQVDRNASKLSGFSLIIGIASIAGVPLAKNIVRLSNSAGEFSGLLDRLGSKLEDAVVKAANQLLKTASGRALAGSSAFGLLPPAYRGIGPAQGVTGLLGQGQGVSGLLPPAYRGIGAAPERSALPAAYRGLPFGFDFGAMPPGGDSGGALVSMESGFISQMKSRYARAARNFLFGIETQVVDLFDSAQQAVNNAVDQYIAAIQSKLLQEARRQVSVKDLGTVMQRAIPPSAGGGNPPLMLPPAGGSSYRFGGGYTPPGGFPVDQPQWPSRPVWKDGASGASSELGKGYYTAGKAIDAFKKSAAGVQSFLSTTKLPLSGAISELGNEFGFAIKQLVLFGTAYKVLAFLQNLPGQAFEAAKSLATYKNQLSAITAETGNFERSFAFVDKLATRFNVPLESARQGFVKLYASMQPAGFSSAQIENLFTGISKATAAFGLSADKVDRVNYAFAQMASKGQITSEELKGQLGDVLPGALALFAQAAKMSIPEFSKAMEDGAFKGKAMQQVLDNVAILMNNKFGPAAAGAAKTLQGATNQIQNNLKLMYESMGPLVDRLAAIFGPQINGLILDATSAMKVFADGSSKVSGVLDTLSPRARAIYDALAAMSPALKAAASSVGELASFFAQLIPVVVQTLSLLIQFAATDFGKALVIAATAVTGLKGALALLNTTGLAAAIKLVYQFVQQLTISIPAGCAASRGAVLLLRSAITGLFIGGIIIGIELLIGRIFDIGNAAEDSKKKIMQTAFALNEMAAAADMQGLAKARIEAENQVVIAERRLQTYEKLKKGGYDSLSALEKKFLKEFGGASAFETDVVGYATKKLGEALEARGQAQRALEAGQKVADQQREKTNARLQNIDLSGGDTKPERGSATTYDAGAISGLQKDQAAIMSDTINSSFDRAMAMIEMSVGRGAGLFQPFVDAYQKILEFNKKNSEASVDIIKLQAQNTGQELRASNVEARNAAKGLNLRTGGSFAGFKINDVPGSPRAYRGGTHEGYDLGTPIGTAISYAVGGVVKSIDKVGRGNAGKLVEVQLENGITGLSMHLSEVLVEVGQRFTAGQVIAKTGDTGAGPAHLHQESAPFAYKTGGAGASLAYLQLNGKGATGRGGGVGGAIGPSSAAVAALNQEQVIARQRALASALEKDVASVYNALLELNSADITSKVNKQFYDLDQALKTIKRETEDTWDRLLPQGEISQFITDSKTLKRELEDLSGKFRDYEILVAESARGEFYAKLLTSPEFMKSEKMQTVIDKLKGLGRTQSDINALIAAGQVSAEAFSAKLSELAKAGVEGFSAQQTALQQLLDTMNKYGLKIAELQSNSQVIQSFGMPTRDLEVAIQREQLKKDKANLESKIATSTNPAEYDLLQLQLDQVKQLEVAYQDLIPGIATVGETMKLAFEPAVSAFTDFILGTKSAGEAFQQFAYDVVSGLAKMAAQAAITQVFKGIFSMFGQGNLFGSLFKAANGAIAPGGFQAFANGGVAHGGLKFQAFAGGGTVSGPTLGLVGEGKYNEAIVPLPNGRSIPVDMKNNGGGDSYNVNVSVDAKGSKVQGDDEKSSQLGSALSAAVQAELLKQKRPGGLLA